MTLESHVTSLDLSKQLKEAGFPQKKSYFYWNTVDPMNIRIIDKYSHPASQALTINPHWLKNIIAAYTATELVEILPYYIGDQEIALPHKSSFDGGKTIEWGWGGYNKLFKKTGFEDTEANARAKLALYLKSKGLLNE